MSVTPLPLIEKISRAIAPPTITWEKPPKDYKFEEKPVDNSGQLLLAAALRESLEITGFIQLPMLIAANLGLCATVNGELVVKAPDWLYVPAVNAPNATLIRRSYTPHLEGDLPILVIEFLSDEDGAEYSIKRTFPPSKWFFYEQILKIPTYAIFEPESGLLELYRLNAGRYELEMPNPEGRHWIAETKLFLGTWYGDKADRRGCWLRWWDASDRLLPWAVEQIEQERQRTNRLAEYLRSQGIDPEQV
jgi:Uma2 family endonuclease